MVPQAISLVNGGPDVNKGPMSQLAIKNGARKAKKGERNNAGLQG